MAAGLGSSRGRRGRRRRALFGDTFAARGVTRVDANAGDAGSVGIGWSVDESVDDDDDVATAASALSRSAFVGERTLDEAGDEGCSVTFVIAVDAERVERRRIRRFPSAQSRAGASLDVDVSRAHGRVGAGLRSAVAGPRRVPVCARARGRRGVRGVHPERLFSTARRPRGVRGGRRHETAARTRARTPRWRTRCSCPRRSTRSSPSCARRCAPPWRRWRRRRERRQG